MEKGFRELDENEKKLIKKVVSGHENEVSHLKLMLEYNKFMLDKMLFSNYLEKRRGFKKQTEEYKNEIMILEKNIKISNEQLENGVEIKGGDSPGMVD